MLRTLVAACLMASATAAGAKGDDSQVAASFEYDRKAPFNLKEIGVEKRAGAFVHDVTFTAIPGSNDEIKAYLVVPEGKGPFAGVLWVHWLGEPATTNRTQYLSEAVGLAPKGVVSLLIDAMWSAPDWYSNRIPERDFDRSMSQVIALRRATDLLASQSTVDPDRLAFVGHDYGAMYGMLVAGLDQRAKAYVFIAAAPSLSDWAFFGRQPRSKAEYLRQNAVLELTDSLRRVKNASTLFQFANADPYVSRASTAVLFDAAHEPKEKKFYDANHSMSAPTVAADRDAWLAKALGLGVTPSR